MEFRSGTAILASQCKLQKQHLLASDQIAQQVSRTGGTPFVVRELVLDYPGGLYAPVSALNQLRRDLLLGAESAIASSWMPGPADISCAMEKAESLIMSLSAGTTSSPGRGSGPMKISVYANSAEVVTAALEAGCDRVYFEPETVSKACRCRCIDTSSPGKDPFPEISGQIRDLLVLLHRKQPANILEMAINS